MSTLKVDKLDPSSGTALEIGSSGDTMTVPSGAQLTIASGATIDISSATLTPPATMPASSGANLTSIPAANITGTMAAVNGAAVTALNATQLTSGTVSTSRFPSGTIVSFDAGFYSAADIGKSDENFTEASQDLRVTITPTSPNKILLVCQGGIPHSGSSGHTMRCSWGIVGGSMNLADSSQGLETYTENYKTGGHSYSILVTPSAYGSAITYTPTYFTDNTCYFTEGSGGQNITTYAMEIQQ